MDWFDEVVREAAPPEVGSSPGVRERALLVATEAVAGRDRLGSWRSRLGRLAGGTGIGFAVLAVGVGAAAASPAVIDWLGWSPAVVAQRTFELGDGNELGLCEVFIRVAPEYGVVSDEETDRRTEAARRFLTEHDWDPLIASITAKEIQAEFEQHQARRDAIATDEVAPPPATLSGAATKLISYRIGTEFDRAGHLQDGVALESAAGPCTGEDDGVGG